MAVIFTDWQHGTYDTGEAFTLDWTSADTIRHAPLLPVFEALRQAAIERFKACTAYGSIGYSADYSSYWEQEQLGDENPLTKELWQKQLFIAQVSNDFEAWILSTNGTACNLFSRPVADEMGRYSMIGKGPFISPSKVAAWSGSVADWPYPWLWFWIDDALSEIGLFQEILAFHAPPLAAWAYMWYRLLALCYIRFCRYGGTGFSAYWSSPVCEYKQSPRRVELSYQGGWGHDTWYAIYPQTFNVQIWARHTGDTVFTRYLDWNGPHTVSQTDTAVIPVDMGTAVEEVICFLDYHVPGGFIFQ